MSIVPALVLVAATLLPTPLERASSTVDGLFQYYQKTEPREAPRKAKFFFSCGQIGGSAPANEPNVAASECKCEDESDFGCVNCYRWWSAVALEALASYAIASNLTPADAGGARILDAAQSTWQHAPYNAFWNATEHPTWVDDFAWYGLAYTRMHDWTADDTWRTRALELLKWGFTYGWDTAASDAAASDAAISGVHDEASSECGGFWWSLHADSRFKDSISIVELMHLAARLASSAAAGSEERASLLADAERVWGWLAAFEGGRGLLAPNGIMSTGAQPEWCCSALAAATTCTTRTNGSLCESSGIAGESYNHGILLSSAALLYNLTADTAYLGYVASLLNAAVANMTNELGAPIDEQRGARSQSTTCNASSGYDPGADFFSFKGIFIAHVGYAFQSLASSGALTPGLAGPMRHLVQMSSDLAWGRSAVFPPFELLDDRCHVPPALPSTPRASNGGSIGSSIGSSTGSSTGDSSSSSSSRSSSNSTVKLPPKFRWWWTNGSTAAVQTPPDPRVWLMRAGLRCTYSVAPIWSGQIDNLAACQERCATKDSCQTYAFANLTHTGLVCSLYAPVTGSARQTEVGCTELDAAYVVGARRPPSPRTASCRAFGCSGTEAKVACQCDALCARHLDCCADYADTCLPAASRMPSCQGRCSGAKLAEAKGAKAAGEASPDGMAGVVPWTVPLPIPGGGYCFCDAGCENSFTDNNSHGGCCADYKWRCTVGGQRDPLCMDARTQAQALNAFVAHHVVEQ